MTAFCILAAGKGVRINKITSLHKCLLNIDNKAVISHIIDKAPQDAEIIVAIGHQKEIVREYCLAAHPDRRFTFVEVDNFDGPGSGPGYSLSCCRSHIQRPFYLVCADCIVAENLPDLSENWIGTFPVTDPEHWSTAHVVGGKVVAFRNKSVNGYDQAFIGIAGIKDYEVFWRQMRSGVDKEFEMVSAFYEPEAYPELKAIPFSWYDTGTPENYNKTKEKLASQSNLGMAKEIDEVTYKVGTRCVKVFGNPNIARGRIERARFLDRLTPNMVFDGKYVYAYEWVEGQTLYEVNNLDVFTSFLEWCKQKLWKQVEIPYSKFAGTCMEFYKVKTLKRVASYFEKKGITTDGAACVNGTMCGPVEIYLNGIDWDWLSLGLPSNFHGDLQFENVITTKNQRFFLIDWRDSFGNVTDHGDLYYDLAKLNAGLSMSFHNIKQDKFWFEKQGPLVKYGFEMTPELAEMRFYYENWLLKHHYDLYKVRLLTALIYLNMAPLHTSPFDEMLFHHSKYLLSLLMI